MCSPHVSTPLWAVAEGGKADLQQNRLNATMRTKRVRQLSGSFPRAEIACDHEEPTLRPLPTVQTHGERAAYDEDTQFPKKPAGYSTADDGCGTHSPES